MNLKGGYKILILPVLSLVSVETSITDKEVLEQLKGLLTYSGNKELKPILIHCEIEESSKVTKHCVMGELKKISDTEYIIIAKIDKAYLIISVEFTLDSETEEYYIASGDAKYLLTKSTSIDGDLEVSGDLEVTGGVTSKGIANTGSFGNIGDGVISGNFYVQEDEGEGQDGNMEVEGSLTVHGSINGEENPSVKPIYCHPISITNTSSKIRLGLMIFNNDATPFTLATLKSFIDNLYTEIGDTVRIITTGAFNNSGVCCIASYIGKNTSGYFLSGLKSADASSGSLTNADFYEIIPSTSTEFNDGVNKIN